jgi:SAM-dependent methyltransferase
MNSAQGKAILALARGGDFAHPGEEVAVEQVAALLPDAAERRILDVGCGRGGTANWFYSRGWGKLVGVDIDGESIQYAQRQYPEIEFFQRDVALLGDLSDEPFDVAYLFNSYYAFPDQPASLRSIRSACRSGAVLLLYDYAQQTRAALPTKLGSEIGKPIALDNIGRDLADSAWRMEDIQDWTDRYVAAYDHLLTRFDECRPRILEISGEGWYDYVSGWYGALRIALADRVLRGVVIVARAS